MRDNFFAAGGPFMWLLLIFLIAIITVSTKKTMDLFIRNDKTLLKLDKGINAILFLGVLSLIFGILGQLSGIYIALGEIIRATDISPQITLIGFRQSFTTTLAGIWILIISIISWFILRSRYKTLSGS